MNGVIIARFKLQSFIVTLATMGIVRGCVYLYRDPAVAVASRLSRPRRDPGRVVPLSMIIMLGCYALVWFYLNRTPAGRATVAIGGNEETVRLAGVNVQRTVVVAYMLLGRAVGALGRDPRLAPGHRAAEPRHRLRARRHRGCVIGGAALGGGGGSVGGTLFGVLTLGLINNLLNLVGVKSSTRTS